MRIKPHLTEKSMQQAKQGFYTFLVGRNMNKFMIKKAIESVFGVNVVSVRTINVKGGSKKNFKGQITKIKSFKKALVSLKDGQSIDVFEEKKKKTKKTKK